MIYYIVKVALSALIIVAISELAKRSSALAALLASLPLTSLLAFVWLYVDTGEVEKIARLSDDIFWLVLPSLVLFVVLPVLLRQGVGFWMSLLIGLGATAVSYLLMLRLIRRALGI